MVFMKIEFLGADREVTGSCHYVAFGETHFLVDCGMEQGADLYVFVPQDEAEAQAALEDWQQEGEKKRNAKKKEKHQ